VRLSKTARYAERFEPHDTLLPDDATVWLLPLDRRVGPFFPGQGTEGLVGRAVGNVQFAD